MHYSDHASQLQGPCHIAAPPWAGIHRCAGTSASTLAKCSWGMGWMMVLSLGLMFLGFCHQVSAGTSIVRETLKEICPSSVQTTVLLDTLAYDGFPAISTLQENWV